MSEVSVAFMGGAVILGGVGFYLSSRQYRFWKKREKFIASWLKKHE